MNAAVPRWARLAGGAAVLAVLVRRLGIGPFLDGLRMISFWPLAAATAITAATTVCSAWRWTLVARGLGVGLPLHTAIAAYYRSQFLNTVLPGGVLGDVHRGLSQGRAAGDVGRGVRAVVWERSAGQVVQAILTLIVLLALDPPTRRAAPLIVAGLAVVLLAGAIALLRAVRGASRIARAASGDLRAGLLARRAWPGVTVASATVVAGHAATFLLAARTAGSSAGVDRLLPLVMLVLMAGALPINLGGWGPREGVAAWAFGAAGLGAAQGVASATVFGVMTLVASSPGALVLAWAWRRGAGPLPLTVRERALASVGAHG